MNSSQLFIASMKMLNDKYQENDKFNKELFMNIYNDIYKSHNTNEISNEINKEILFKISNFYKNIIIKPTEKTESEELELKVKELENQRNTISSVIPSLNKIKEATDDFQPNISLPSTIQLINNKNEEPKFKTFIINTIKNNFKIIPNVDLNKNLVYPSTIFLPSIIKYNSPFILLSLNDGISTINYTFIPHNIIENGWDIWIPIINDYNSLNLNGNKQVLTIGFFDFLGHSIDFNQFKEKIIDILEIDNNFSINIGNNYNKFNINDKIKLIKDNNDNYETSIINIDNQKKRLLISNTNINIQDLLNTYIYNYKNQFSIIFKYSPK